MPSVRVSGWSPAVQGTGVAVYDIMRKRPATGAGDGNQNTSEVVVGKLRERTWLHALASSVLLPESFTGVIRLAPSAPPFGGLSRGSSGSSPFA
ncbi:putative ABC-type transport system, ATP-binding protein [Desulfovibrio ferrophilus]|uniref:Putative ABC-type transport system, ATP-binding protein n=1 Tax=Desulfovibrio ferrophilus TaxID=241368 RepID=A0A2Z6AXX5_9BACT|nr:putative ABC-type transport system, ATP-binding protein [Desulfovibrio ferrophilus]